MMKRCWIVLVTTALVASSAYSQEGRSFAAGRFGMSVDGKFAGFIKKVSGGTIKGEVTTHTLGTSNFQRKHLATISHEPLYMDVAMGGGGPLWDWIEASWDKGFTGGSGSGPKIEFDFLDTDTATSTGSDTQANAFQLNGATLQQVETPAFGASGAGLFNLSIVAQSATEGPLSLPADSPPQGPVWQADSFSLQVPGLPGDSVIRIEPFSGDDKVLEITATGDSAQQWRAAQTNKPASGRLQMNSNFGYFEFQDVSVVDVRDQADRVQVRVSFSTSRLEVR